MRGAGAGPAAPTPRAGGEPSSVRAETSAAFSIFYARSGRGVISGVARICGVLEGSLPRSRLSHDVLFSTGLHHSLVVVVTKLGYSVVFQQNHSVNVPRTGLGWGWGRRGSFCCPQLLVSFC